MTWFLNDSGRGIFRCPVTLATLLLYSPDLRGQTNSDNNLKSFILLFCGNILVITAADFWLLCPLVCQYAMIEHYHRNKLSILCRTASEASSRVAKLSSNQLADIRSCDSFQRWRSLLVFFSEGRSLQMAQADATAAHGINIHLPYEVNCRVTSTLENLKISVSFTPVGETSGILLNVSKVSMANLVIAKSLKTVYC